MADDADPVYRIGRNVSTPVLLHKVDPEYSAEARAEKIQGTALYTGIVGKSGKLRDIELLSPVGYGLDEKGLEAIQQWVFKPGEKDGTPASVRVTIEVNFRLGGFSFDTKAEQERTSFNSAVHDLQRQPANQRARETIEKLAAQKYPAAMALLGEWMIDGTNVPKNIPGGVELIRKAADKNDANGLYALAVAYSRGLGLPMDTEKGLKLFRDASTHGSPAAQLYLGSRYETGDGAIKADKERARYYFRLCAARGNTECAFRLGKLLMPVEGESKGDAVQAVAWLELASDGSVGEAGSLAQSLRGKLSPEEAQMAEKLKAQLLRH